MQQLDLRLRDWQSGADLRSAQFVGITMLVAYAGDLPAPSLAGLRDRG
jgi:hypothetical protein